MEKKIIIGTRGSILALAQAKEVKKNLSFFYPEYNFEIKPITTSGDKDLKSNWENSDKSLKSFFTKEIEQELLEGTIDIAVHSMKDMPSISPKGLICGAISEREDVRDVLVSKEGKLFPMLPKGAKIGTSSLRRTMNMKTVREDLEIKHLRGNIHTRLKKLEEEDYDAIVLAAAGLKRVGLADRITEYLDGTIFPPAPAQGALYIQCRENDSFIKELLTCIHDEKTAKIVEIEREFSKIFDGGCHTPMGCYSQVNGDKIKFTAVYSDGGKQIKAVVEEYLSKGKEIAYVAAEEIKSKINKGTIQ
ncbi:MAG: hydroxymethylbilane synthase [Fusobacterium sp.]|uniref:hydroxymethylbilane synthase n=1 Tax=Fusobacterium sp. TaxID=68766 RepID=UPI0026DD004A|nr:hydroxymethylbilane synthase [Fusobacterium sp.]MDO4689701.1 hydroxymethylbilane synthase [Fusobacterium sp.]